MSNLILNQFTAYGRNRQLVLSLNSEKLLPENAPVRLTRAQLEELDYRKLYEAYSSKGRKSKVDPSVLFQVIAYAYQCGIYTSRKIEEACRYRVDFLWLLDGKEAPDHATLLCNRQVWLTPTKFYRAGVQLALAIFEENK